MPYPHTFEFLRLNENPAVVLCGAGASFGLNPLPNDILKAHREAAETAISELTGKAFPALELDLNAGNALYVWAKQALDELIAIGHHCPKLKLAQVLGITSDERWLAGVLIPVANAKPRHRVIARLIREESIHSIWTFNWDCHIESALKSIGFCEGGEIPTQPWRVRYQCVLGLRDFGNIPKDRTVIIHKRHGCVKNLKELEGLDRNGEAKPGDYENLRFLITEDELSEVLDKNSADYRSFQGQIDYEFSGRPLTVCGWSASEKYLLDELDICKAQLRKYPNPIGRLSIVDPQFNNKGHARLSDIYDVTKAQAHFPITPAPDVPDVDNLFLWVQTLYALDSIRKMLNEHKPLQDWLGVVIAGVEKDPRPSWLTNWADVFLPMWVQFCWRGGLVTARNRNEPMRPEEIQLQGDEWYVPLCLPINDRPELISAAYLLRRLSDRTSPRKFDLVPGAILQDAKLILPLPAWGNPNWLNSVSRSAARIKQSRGFVEKIVLLALTTDGAPATTDKKTALKRAYIEFSGSTADADVSVIGLEEI